MFEIFSRIKLSGVDPVMYGLLLRALYESQFNFCNLVWLGGRNSKMYIPFSTIGLGGVTDAWCELIFANTRSISSVSRNWFPV